MPVFTRFHTCTTPIHSDGRRSTSASDDGNDPHCCHSQDEHEKDVWIVVAPPPPSPTTGSTPPKGKNERATSTSFSSATPLREGRATLVERTGASPFHKTQFDSLNGIFYASPSSSSILHAMPSDGAPSSAQTTTGKEGLAAAASPPHCTSTATLPPSDSFFLSPSQESVYAHSCVPFLGSSPPSLLPCPALVYMCYGSAGAGKTYTLWGRPSSPSSCSPFAMGGSCPHDAHASFMHLCATTASPTTSSSSSLRSPMDTMAGEGNDTIQAERMAQGEATEWRGKETARSIQHSRSHMRRRTAVPSDSLSWVAHWARVELREKQNRGIVQRLLASFFGPSPPPRLADGFRSPSSSSTLAAQKAVCFSCVALTSSGSVVDLIRVALHDVADTLTSPSSCGERKATPLQRTWDRHHTKEVHGRTSFDGLSAGNSSVTSMPHENDEEGGPCAVSDDAYHAHVRQLMKEAFLRYAWCGKNAEKEADDRHPDEEKVDVAVSHGPSCPLPSHDTPDTIVPHTFWCQDVHGLCFLSAEEGWCVMAYIWRYYYEGGEADAVSPLPSPPVTTAHFLTRLTFLHLHAAEAPFPTPRKERTPPKSATGKEKEDGKDNARKPTSLPGPFQRAVADELDPDRTRMGEAWDACEWYTTEYVQDIVLVDVAGEEAFCRAATPPPPFSTGTCEAEATHRPTTRPVDHPSTTGRRPTTPLAPLSDASPSTPLPSTPPETPSHAHEKWIRNTDVQDEEMHEKAEKESVFTWRDSEGRSGTPHRQARRIYRERMTAAVPPPPPFSSSHDHHPAAPSSSSLQENTLTALLQPFLFPDVTLPSHATTTVHSTTPTPPLILLRCCTLHPQRLASTVRVLQVDEGLVPPPPLLHHVSSSTPSRKAPRCCVLEHNDAEAEETPKHERKDGVAHPLALSEPPERHPMASGERERMTEGGSGALSPPDKARSSTAVWPFFRDTPSEGWWGRPPSLLSHAASSHESDRSTDAAVVAPPPPPPVVADGLLTDVEKSLWAEGTTILGGSTHTSTVRSRSELLSSSPCSTSSTEEESGKREGITRAMPPHTNAPPGGGEQGGRVVVVLPHALSEDERTDSTMVHLSHDSTGAGLSFFASERAKDISPLSSPSVSVDMSSIASAASFASSVVRSSSALPPPSRATSPPSRLLGASPDTMTPADATPSSLSSLSSLSSSYSSFTTLSSEDEQGVGDVPPSFPTSRVAAAPVSPSPPPPPLNGRQGTCGGTFPTPSVRQPPPQEALALPPSSHQPPPSVMLPEKGNALPREVVAHGQRHPSPPPPISSGASEFPSQALLLEKVMQHCLSLTEKYEACVEELAQVTAVWSTTHDENVLLRQEIAQLKAKHQQR